MPQSNSYKSIFTSTIFDDCFKFAFVRNPWDRIYSGYKFIIQGGFGLPTDLQLQKDIQTVAGSSFPTFVKHWLTTKKINEYVIFRPQHTFICNAKGHILVDRICYFENFQREYDCIQRRLGLERKLIHLNRTQNAIAYTEIYDEEMKAIISHLYQQDIELFGYEFISNRVLNH